MKPLLTKLTTVDIPALPSFSGKQFKKDGFWLGSSFEKNFLEKKEPKTTTTTLRVSLLERDSLDGPILEELGESAEITLGQLYAFLETADHSVWYAAYVRDSVETLWAVYCDWYSGYGWRVLANSVPPRSSGSLTTRCSLAILIPLFLRPPLIL